MKPQYVLMVVWLFLLHCIGCASMQPQASTESQPLEGIETERVDASEGVSPVVSGSDEASAMATVALRFSPRGGLDVLEVVAEAERAFYLSGGYPLVAVLELKANYSTVGKYSLAAQYSSLYGFASAMQAQEPAYRWVAVNDSTLVVKPATGAELDKNVSNFSSSSQTACDILSQLAVRLNPPQGDSGACIVRDTPAYIPARAAYDVMQQKLSVSYSGTRSAQATVLDILGRLNSAVGVTVYRWDSRMNVMWEVRW
jgi:hypothetical protein